MRFNLKNKKISDIYDKLLSNNIMFYLIPFVVLGLWMLIKGRPHAAGYYLIHYLYTYDHGFIPRGLLGEVISWFTDSVSSELISNITAFFSALLVATASLCIGKFLSKIRENKENFNISSVIIIFLCLLPTTFALQFESMHLDKIIWALTFLAVYIADNKSGIWFVPVLCVISTLINPYYVFGSMILIAIILLQKFVTNNYSFKNGLICAISYIAIIAIAIYGPIAETKVGFTTPEEMVDFYFSRYTETLTPDVYNGFVEEWLYDYFEPVERIIELSFKYYFIDWGLGKKTLFYFVFVALPMWTLLGSLWIKAIKKEENRFQKFIYFLCLISPVVIIPVQLIGWEFPRYFTDNLVVQLCLLIYFIAHKHPAVKESVNDIITFFKENVILSVAALIQLSFIFVL